MTNTSNRAVTEIQELYESAVAAESTKGLFVGIYEYGKAVQKQDNWKNIFAAISKSKEAGSKELNQFVDDTWKYVDRTIAILKKKNMAYDVRSRLENAISYRAEKNVENPETEDNLERACGALWWYEHRPEPDLRAIGKEAGLMKKQYKDAIHLFERMRETSGWYAWEKIEEYLEAYEGDHRLKEKWKGKEHMFLIAAPWVYHASDLKTIMNDRWETDTLFVFQKEPYKGYLMRFHRWLLDTFPSIAEAPCANPVPSAGPAYYERLEQGYKRVIKVGEVQVAFQQGTKKSKFLETLVDAGGDEVTYEQIAEDLNERKTGTQAKLQLWRKYDQQYYGINNSFAGKGIVGFLSKTSKGFKVSETYKRRGA